MCLKKDGPDAEGPVAEAVGFTLEMQPLTWFYVEVLFWGVFRSPWLLKQKTALIEEVMQRCTSFKLICKTCR